MADTHAASPWLDCNALEPVTSMYIPATTLNEESNKESINRVTILAVVSQKSLIKWLNRSSMLHENNSTLGLD